MALHDMMKSIILSPVLRPRLHRAMWLVWFVELKQLGFNLKKNLWGGFHGAQSPW